MPVDNSTPLSFARQWCMGEDDKEQAIPRETLVYEEVLATVRNKMEAI